MKIKEQLAGDDAQVVRVGSTHLHLLMTFYVQTLCVPYGHVKMNQPFIQRCYLKSKCAWCLLLAK